VQVVFAFIQELAFNAPDSEGMNLLIGQLFAKDGEEVQVGGIVVSLMRSEDLFVSHVVEPLTKLNEQFSLHDDVVFEVFDRGAEVVQTPVFRHRV
jgi:hypothetical protein